MEVNLYARVAASEVYALRKEHGSVAVGVKNEHLVVQPVGLLEVGSLLYEPQKQRQSAVQTFGMPLHTHDGFELAAFDCLDETVC